MKYFYAGLFVDKDTPKPTSFRVSTVQIRARKPNKALAIHRFKQDLADNERLAKVKRLPLRACKLLHVID